MKPVLVAVGLVFAYLVLFLAGVAAFGPGGGEALTPAEQASSTWMILVVAGLDVALFRAWLVRARDRGALLWLQAFVVFYGIKTLSSQLEVWYFVDAARIPPEMLPGLFAMTLPLAVGWTGLVVWAWGPRDAEPGPAGRSGLDLAVRIGLAGAVLYPVLFFAAGYFVAWQNDAVRAYYGGPEVPLPLWEHLAGLDPWVVPFEMGRGLLWVAIGWPVLRRTRGPWSVGGLLFAAMLAVVQNDVHLLPNPLMPREVRVWHLVETASSNFVFGLGTAALLAPRLGESARWPVWEGPSDRTLAAVCAPLVALLAVGGLGGGLALWMEPSGAWLGMDRALLAASPFPDFEVPGLVLLLANGVLPLAALAALWARNPRAPWWVAASGAVLVGWMAAQLAWVGYVMWLQAVLLGWGLALFGLGAWWLAARLRDPDPAAASVRLP